MPSPLYERVRPQTFAEVVGQDKTVAKLAFMRARGGLAGRAYFLSGKSGTGKSSIARIIAAEVAEDFAIVEVDAETLTAAQIIELRRKISTRTIGPKTGHAVIIDECHGLSKGALSQMLKATETFPDNAVWILTTTTEGLESFSNKAHADALLSRFCKLPLSQRDLSAPFAKRVKEACEQFGLGLPTIEDCIQLAKRCGNNLRAMLSAVECGEFA